MATATTDQPATWKVVCIPCRAVLAEGTGDPPTQLDLTGHMTDDPTSVNIRQHLEASAAGGVHKISLQRSGRVTEKL